MSIHSRLGIVTFALTMAAGAQVYGPGAAAAESVAGTLSYQCVLAPFPSQTMTARIVWHAPSEIAVGQTTPAVTVDATATVSDTVTWALGLVKAATVEGSVHAPGVVRAPEGNVDAALPLTVPRTSVPASGPMTVRATGTAPRLTFRQPGHASVIAGDSLAMHFIPKDASGNLTDAGEVDLSCTLDPGQDTVVFSFDITPPAAAPPAAGTPGRTDTPTAGPTRSGTAGPATSGTDGSTPGTPTSNAAAPTTLRSTGPTSGTDPTTEVANVVSQAANRWLIGAGILAGVAAVFGGLWWLRRRKA